MHMAVVTLIGTKKNPNKLNIHEHGEQRDKELCNRKEGLENVLASQHSLHCFVLQVIRVSFTTLR